MHYQMVLPEGTSLDDLIVKCATAVVDGVPNPVQPVTAARASVGRALRGHLEPHLATFDTCGLERVCLDAMEPATASAPAGLPVELHARLATRVLHLETPKGFLPFEIGLTRAALAALPVRVDGEAATELEPGIAAALGRILEPLLYKSPLCGSGRCVRIAAPAELHG